MTSNWQKLADVWYRKQEFYSAHWADEPNRLHVSVVAGAPYGGPVATVRDERVFQQVRGSLKPELQIWTSAGRLISSAPWIHTGLLAMDWSSDEILVCVFESGIVRTFSVFCEEERMFTVDLRIKQEGGANLAALWSSGMTLLTKRFSLFVNASFTRSGDACFRCPDIKVTNAPHCLCVLPPPYEESADVQVIIGTTEGPVLLADRNEVRDLSSAGLDDGPYMAFAVSNNKAGGRFLACLSCRGVFKVLMANDDMRVVDEATLDCKKKPKQMVWCGADCIALYYTRPSPSNTLQHVLFIGGPQGEWNFYQYDTPFHLVSECDGVRILGTHKVEFVQRLPESTEEIFSIGNCDPSAMLTYAVDRYQKGDVCAQESLRLIKDTRGESSLADAVNTCIDAARYEHEMETVDSLLNAAVFGRHFLVETFETERFAETCKNLRICLALRKEPIEIPLTVPQWERIGPAGLAMRLARRHQHLVAARICEWIGHPRDNVLLHWACEKIKRAQGSSQTDEQLCEAVLEKFRGCPGIGYAEVARVAAETYRPHLATLLLNYEPRGHAQVQVLLQLSREGADDENRHFMLQNAAEKAVQSYDPDLLHDTISAACGGDPCGRGADIMTLVQVCQKRPQELNLVNTFFAATMQQGRQFERVQRFHEQLGQAKQVAYSSVHQVFQRTSTEERARWLQMAKGHFSQTLPQGTPEAEKFAMQFAAQECAEEAELLKIQMGYEEQSVMKRWLGGPYRFAGLSLVDTLAKLISVGEIIEADNLAAKKLSDKRYWRIKVQALSEAGKLEDLTMLAQNRTSPIGYELFIEAFLKHNRTDFALPLVPKVKSLEQQANYYSRMGMEEEAQRVRAQGQERSGPGRIFQNMLGLR